MSSYDAKEGPTGQAPPWLDAATLRFMETERNKAFVWGRDALAAAEMVRQLLLARHPALPMTMIDEAVAAVAPDADGRSYAAQLVDHLMRSNFRVIRREPKAGRHGQGW